MICCICLNLTNIKQVRQVILEFFAKYPDPETCAKADPEQLSMLIRPLGLYNRRARTMIKLSDAFLKPWDSVYDLPGVGKYAADSYRIFVDGKMDVDPSDEKLQKYVEWARGR